MTNPTKAIPANTQLYLFFINTSIKARIFRIPKPNNIIPGMKKSGNTPCNIRVGIFIKSPLGDKISESPPLIPPTPSIARIDNKTRRCSED